MKNAGRFPELSAICVASALAATVSMPGLAQDAPRASVASPDVYKVLAENETHRIILVTWKPGQRDEFHSHPAGMGVVYLTNCSLRGYAPDGKSMPVEREAGQARFQGLVKSHSVKNMGSQECRLVLFEPK